jgi:predicted TPR repeat methyltransferase
VTDAERFLSVQEAVDTAVRLQRAGHLDAAEELYRRVLESAPGNPDALHFLGVLSHQRGRSAEAADLIRQALERVPDYPDALSNLGNVLRSQGELAEAENCYRRALALRPDHPPALLMLGAVLDAQGRGQEAADNYLRAVDGGSCEPDLLRLVAATLRADGRLDEAAALYRRWLAVRPGDAYALHLLAACTRQDVPERAADSYVESLFDCFAATFDDKLAELDYRAPTLVGEAVARIAGPPRGNLVVLDAGCGTGLCGRHLRPHARELVGVDLSAEMLARAQQRGVYDRLEKSELTAFLQGSTESLDLVVSADTLVYFGALDAVLAAVARALRPGGHLVLTLERADAEAAPAGYRLNCTGRYSHAQPYVESALRRAGLEALGVDRVAPRKEGGEDVDGLLVVARRPAATG